MIDEQCWVLTGRVQDNLWWGRQRAPASGHPTFVRFDPQFVLAREERCGDVVGFLHTHPSFVAEPSQRDDRTMWAWVLSLGRPLVCVIHGTDGLRAFWYVEDQKPAAERQVLIVRRRLVGVTY